MSMKLGGNWALRLCIMPGVTKHLEQELNVSTVDGPTKMIVMHYRNFPLTYRHHCWCATVACVWGECKTSNVASQFKYSLNQVF